MRRLGLLLTVIVFAGSGCAMTKTRPDTIDTQPAVIDTQPAVDVSGKWVGTWRAYDAMGFPRNEDATADLLQQGGSGTGRLVLHTTGVALSVPDVLRDPGLTGARVTFDVSGDDVVIRHELSGRLFAADLKVEGDRMVGYVRGAKPPVKVVLTRRNLPTPVAAAPAPPPAASPAPAPVAPEPPKAEQPIAAAPEPAPAPAPAEPARPAPAEFTGIAEVQPIHFDFDKSEIRPNDAELLEANAEWLKENEEALVLIEGHTDERGTPEYNLALGERRAKAARDYLIAHGVVPDRISIVSFGTERPICSEGTESCWSENRRAMFLVKPR